LRSSDKHLKAKLTEIVKAEEALTRLVADCKADGVIEPSELNEMLSVVSDYLEMNPNHAVIQRLQEDLISRMASDPVSHASLANFPAAVLKRLPPLTNSIGMKLKLLPLGVFTMGDEGAEHEVRLTKPFMLGLHEVTQSQYERVMGKNPSKFKGANNPVEQVSWEDAVKFCQKLSALPAEKAAGRVYRLPTEAEWEYACRAGTTTKYSFGDDDTELGDYAWFRGNSGQTSHPVGGKKPNAWGLYDMHGNVFEWCQDWYGDYPGRTVTNPSGANSGSYRVLRGGSWFNAAEFCRSASRRRFKPSFRYDDYGFRVSLSPSGE
jgi:formylglycine-generating enzyme required for sulfatase activity